MTLGEVCYINAELEKIVKRLNNITYTYFEDFPQTEIGPTELMDKAREFIRESGLEQKTRAEMLPLLQSLRNLYESREAKMQFETPLPK